VDATIGWWDDFFWAAVEVAQVFFVALAGTVALGLMGAAAKLSKSKIAQKIANGYTIVFRGTPEILVLLLIYFGSAITLTAIVGFFDPTIVYVDIPPFWAGSFGISLIVGSYATETFRGAFLGVDPGQIEAARALGISNLKTFFYVRVLNELLFVAEQGMGATAKPFPFFIAVGGIYLAFSTLITLTAMGLEKRANRHLAGSR
jgi:polar amino acid transport system permease protein